MCEAASSVRHDGRPLESGPPDDDLTTSSSIFEFLQQERRCDGGGGAIGDDDSELDIDSIFEEINRLSGDTRGRCVEDILREAEALISKQELGQLEVPLLAVRKTKSAATVQPSRLPMRKKNRQPVEAPSVVNVCTSENSGNADREQSSDDEGYLAHYELNKVIGFFFKLYFILILNAQLSSCRFLFILFI